MKPVIRQVAFAPFLVTLFFVVSGGPNGLEPLVSQSGPGMALVLILLAPLLYAIPSALMTAELASAYPHNGGYYIWVKEAFGEFSGFLCAFWTLIYCVIDTSLYPLLFAGAVSGICHDQLHLAAFQDPGSRYALAMVIAVLFTGVNLLGIRAVGAASMILGVLCVVPFIVMVALAAPQVIQHAATIGHPLVLPGKTPGDAASAGLALIIWNYLGWDSLSTTAEEVHDAPTTIRRSLTWALPAIVGIYLFCTVAGMAVMPNSEEWVAGSWVVAAGRIAGPWLAYIIAASLAVSNCGMFSANLLGITRVPQALARDGLLPKALRHFHSRLGTPVVPVLLVSACVLALVQFSFDTLVTWDVLVYSLALMLEFGALYWLRIKAPDKPRPYRVPGGKTGALLLGFLPLILMIWVGKGVLEKDRDSALIFAAKVLISGPVAYGLLCWYRRWARKREAKLILEPSES